MKIGINAWAFPGNLSIPQGLKLAKGAEFDCVELNISEDGYLTPDSDEAACAFLRGAAENMSLELRSLCCALTGAYPLTANDPAVVERAKEIVTRSLTLCNRLGADTLLVIPGFVTPDVSYDVAFQRALAALKELAPAAEEAGVYLAVENIWNKFLLSPLEMRDFIDSIGSQMVRAYFDIGNVMVNGFPEQWIRILGSRICKVHAKDFRVSAADLSGFTSILDGDVNWTEVKRALKDVGYDDVVTAEISDRRILPDLGIRHCGESLKRLFKGGK